MRRWRKVKILATLGPSSSDKAKIKALSHAGADVFRINMSHTDHPSLRRMVNTIRAIEEEGSRPIGILADLQGPKLRIGTFADGKIELTAGDSIVLDSDPKPGNQKRVYLPHPEIFEAIEPGHRLLLDDGKVRLRVTKASKTRATAFIEAGTALSDRKGISVPDSTLGFSALTDKDRSDLDAALDAGVDWIALSFVQRPEDLAEVKKIARGRALVMAKIEKP
ncbi:MAG: pyruvate kinase, partial [Bauldia litoralis]